MTNIADIKAAAYGRWGNEIIPYFGIDKAILNGKHSPCPIHGGKDGFRFTDEGRGCWVCATCTDSKFLDGFNLWVFLPIVNTNYRLTVNSDYRLIVNTDYRLNVNTFPK